MKITEILKIVGEYIRKNSKYCFNDNYKKHGWLIEFEKGSDPKAFFEPHNIEKESKEECLERFSSMGLLDRAVFSSLIKKGKLRFDMETNRRIFASPIDFENYFT